MARRNTFSEDFGAVSTPTWYSDLLKERGEEHSSAKHLDAPLWHIFDRFVESYQGELPMEELVTVEALKYYK